MPIGRKVLLLHDKNREDILSKNNEYRKIPISIFYPTNDKGESFYSQIYSPKEELYYKIYGKKDENGSDNRSYLESIKTDFINNATLNKEKKNLPVVLFSHGLTADRDFYLFLIEHLVKNGYMVVTTGHLRDTDFTLLPDGNIVEMNDGIEQDLIEVTRAEQLKLRSYDVQFVASYLKTLNQSGEFARMFNLDQVAAIGHSMGGITVLQALERSEIIKAAILLDAAIMLYEGKQIPEESTTEYFYNKPILNFRRDMRKYSRKDKNLIDLQNTFNINADFNMEEKFNIVLDHAVHLTFTDWFTLNPEPKHENISHQYEVINDVCLRFLDEYLLKKNNSYSEMIEENINKDINVLELTNVGENFSNIESVPIEEIEEKALTEDDFIEQIIEDINNED